MPSSNIITYAETTFAPFDVLPFCPADSLIFSCLSYLHVPLELSGVFSWEGLPLRELFRAEYFDRYFQDIWDPAGSRRLLTALAASPRFRDVRVAGFREELDAEAEKQFAAVGFQLTPNLCCLSFRGTDATLVGWKEDFNMAFLYPVPSQSAAAAYLSEAAGHLTGKILLTGHSKGGNLAMYCAANCPKDLQERFLMAYSHDGPGFQDEVLSLPEFAAATPRIHKTMPQSSLVGMLLANQENCRIVKSTSFNLLQHDPFSWVVENGDFCYTEQLTRSARRRDENLNTWIRQLSREERGRFVDALYGVLSDSDITQLPELTRDWRKSIPSLVRTTAQLEPQTRDFLFQTVGALISLSLKRSPRQ